MVRLFFFPFKIQALWNLLRKHSWAHRDTWTSLKHRKLSPRICPIWTTPLETLTTPISRWGWTTAAPVELFSFAIVEFCMILGGQPMPFCFYPLSKVTRNCKTSQQPQLWIWHTKQIKLDFPSTPSGVFRTISLWLTTGREKMAFRDFCCKKRIWRWLATQDHANSSLLFGTVLLFGTELLVLTKPHRWTVNLIQQILQKFAGYGTVLVKLTVWCCTSWKHQVTSYSNSTVLMKHRPVFQQQSRTVLQAVASGSSHNALHYLFCCQYFLMESVASLCVCSRLFEIVFDWQRMQTRHGLVLWRPETSHRSSGGEECGWEASHRQWNLFILYCLHCWDGMIASEKLLSSGRHYLLFSGMWPFWQWKNAYACSVFGNSEQD